jgi:WD40 repeat protein
VALYNPTQEEEVIYEVRSGQIFRNLPATPLLMGASFSPDGQYLAYGNGTRAMVTEVVSGETTTLEPAQVAQIAPEMGVSRIIWSPDGQALATVFGVEGGDSEGPGVIVLWKRLENGSFKEIYHVPNVQANYTLPNQVLAIFNPSGSRVALQLVDAMEAGHFRLVVYDVDEETVVRSLPEYKPGAWMNDDELLAAEAQYDTRLTRINVVTLEKTVGNGRDNGDNAYAPGGEYIAQMAMPPLQGVMIKYWRSNGIVAFLDHESLNLMDYAWSPDGRWLASIGDDGTLKVWPVGLR